jgi:hypothetical protein
MHMMKPSLRRVLPLLTRVLPTGHPRVHAMHQTACLLSATLPGVAAASASASNGGRTELVVKTCEADVIERHLETLTATQRVAAG